jgi:hypothetical protein
MTTETIQRAEAELQEKLYNKIRIEKIKQFVDRYYGFNIEKNTRVDEYVRARTMYYFICRSYTPQPFSNIGALLNRDHSTVIHSLKNNHEFYANNDQFYKNGLESFYDYIVRYVGLLEPEDDLSEDILHKALKETVLARENILLKEQLSELNAEHQLLLQSVKVSAVLGEMVNKIPQNKLPIVVERLNAMIKML